MNYESSHLKVFFKVGVPKKYAKILKNTFEGKYALVNLQVVCL